MGRRFGLAALVALSLSAPAAGQLGPQERPVQRNHIDAWLNRARIVEETLRAGDFQKADHDASALLEEMLRVITVGPDAGRLLALPISLRAVARAGLGSDRDSLWDLQTAIAISPAAGDISLAPYGEAGARLAAKRRESDAAPPAPPVDSAAGWKKPERLSGAQPLYPPAFRRAVREARVVLEVTLNQLGVPERPTILDMERGGPVMAVAALESVRTWKFEPARLEGRPAAARYSLVVSYRIGPS